METERMQTVTSKDGTEIAFDKTGQGPALILVGGALDQRAMESGTAQLAASPLLTQHFTVVNYDRRGRGDSTDTQPYAVEREIEDIEALINEAGGSAVLVGFSSGAALALEAAIKLGNKVKGLSMYEAPYNDDTAARQAAKQYTADLKEALAAGRRGDAVGLFLTFIGTPPGQVDGMRKLPMWPMLEAIAPTLAYDASIMGDDFSVPTRRAASVTVSTLVMEGGASPPFMRITAMSLAKAIPEAQYRTLEGQAHDVTAGAIAPVLAAFFKAR
jgi:pimeloyl-ACP methyl ester carboxylesterase